MQIRQHACILASASGPLVVRSDWQGPAAGARRRGDESQNQLEES